MHHPNQNIAKTSRLLAFKHLWLQSFLPISTVSTISLLLLFCCSGFGIKPAHAQELTLDQEQQDEAVSQLTGDAEENNLEPNQVTPTVVKSAENVTPKTEFDSPEPVDAIAADHTASELAQLLSATAAEQAEVDVNSQFEVSTSSRLPLAVSFRQSPNLRQSPKITKAASLSPVFANYQPDSTVKIASQPVTNTTADLVESRSVHSSQLWGEAVKTSQQPVENPQTNLTTSDRAVGVPEVQFQGVYILQGEDDAARARVTGTYAFSPHVLVGATVDLTSGTGLADSQITGLSVNELYLAASPANLPNLKFVVGQMDLTSYFDRNSFAKDGATHFFNPVFQTNPALSATSIASRPGVLVNWAITDDIEAKAATFSSSRDLGEFAFDGFAGELGARFGNAIVRATYASARDAGSKDGFAEIFQLDRGNGRFGTRSGDREEAYGINGEYFIPNLKMGIFGRYGRYENRAIDKGGDTYSFGVNFLDLFQRHDRLGLGYGRQLSNNDLRDRAGKKVPDVLELFYDFRVSPNLRLGFTVQGRDEFSETVLGFRVKTEFDISSAARRVFK